MALSVPAGYANPATGVAPVQPRQLNIGGIMSVRSLADTLAIDAQRAQEQASAATAAAQQMQQVVTNLTSLIRHHWSLAKTAKEDIERKMLNAVRSRRGEYPPEKLNLIRRQGGSEIYMLLFATKARQAKALLTDVIIGTGAEKPWTLAPTAKPDLPPERVSEIMQATAQLVMQMEMEGQGPSIPEIRQVLQEARDSAEAQIMELARLEAARAEMAIEDLLQEGNWLEALEEFLDDLTTFKTAFLMGPVAERVPCLKWQTGPDGTTKPVVYEETKLFYKRVDPFMIYPVPWAKNTNDAPLLHRHQLTRMALSSMKGVDGYDDAAIDAVLDQHGKGGLHEWLSIDVLKPVAEGRLNTVITQQSDLIDALQYWGTVSGKMLREWGMDETKVPDPSKEYNVECWLIGTHVIKAVINGDPMGRRPYYSDGYSRIPGAFWHNSLFDILEDCQDMCNGAARALANNLGIASGPQVDVNIDRIAPGETITEMYPWRIWQTLSDPMGSTSKAVNFFQPQSYADQLMKVFEYFSQLADEYSGIPKYMAGFNEGSGGAGRTASGMSMMIGNANKTIKQLVSSVDMRVISASVGRLYEQRIQVDPDMRGDLRCMARGAMSLATREAAQVRRNEFLQFTANPFDMQIMGLDGRAAVLRETAKTLQMNPDDVVPNKAVLRQRMFQQAQQMAQQQQLPAPGGAQLQNGAPVTNDFAPVAA